VILLLLLLLFSSSATALVRFSFDCSGQYLRFLFVTHGYNGLIFLGVFRITSYLITVAISRLFTRDPV
jgi:hypothetical protein